MTVEIGDFIQLLEMIILAVTAEIFIAQFAMRVLQRDEVVEVLKATDRQKAVDNFNNGAKATIVSVSLFAVGGILLMSYLITFSVPTQIEFFMEWTESILFWIVSLIIVIFSVGIIAYWIDGDVENPTRGFMGVIISSFFAGSISFFIIFTYIGLWALTRSPEWLFFLGMIFVAGGMATFLVGAMAMGLVFSNILDVLYDDL